MGFFKSFFKIKSRPKKQDLEKAKEMKLITEQELLKLTLERAERKYEEYLEKNQPKIKRRKRR